jgi:DNA uptake protein ComE-like DNA-binding protein
MQRFSDRTFAAAVDSRRGFVLLLVLVVVALLSFAVYSFSALMVTEFGATRMGLQHLKRRQLAESAVELAVADLQTPARDIRKTSVAIPLADGESGRLTLLRKLPTGRNVAPEFGWLNESSKLNLRSLPLKTTRRPQARRRLTVIPGMTVPLADSLLDWIDEDNEPSEFGAEAEWYLAQATPRVPRNAMCEDLSELLSVRGMTAAILFGEDQNRNGILDPEEDDGGLQDPDDNQDGLLQTGIAGYLTLVSAESQASRAGTPRIHLNSTELAKLYDQILPRLGAEAALFIVAGRLHGITWLDDIRPDEGEDQRLRLMERLENANERLKIQLGLLNQPKKNVAVHEYSRGGLVLDGNPSFEFRSIVDLFGGQVRVTVEGKDRVLQSPWAADAATISRMLPELEEVFCLTMDRAIYGRIDINSASEEVLASIPGVSSSLARAIHSLQPAYEDRGKREFRSTAWLLNRGLVATGEYRAMAPYITVGGSVYSGIAIGQIEGERPVAAIRFLVDCTDPQPRMLLFQDLPILTADSVGLRWEKVSGDVGRD